MGRARTAKADEDKKAYNNAKSKAHYDSNRDSINEARRQKYAEKARQLQARQARKVKKKRLPQKLTDEEKRIRKAEANRAYYERKKDSIMAKRRSNGPRPRKASPNGWSRPSSYPIWQNHIDFLRAKVRKALLGCTVKAFGEAAYEACLSQSSCSPLDAPLTVFGDLQTRAHRLEMDMLNNLGAGVHTSQTQGLRGDINLIIKMLEDIYCEGLMGFDGMRQAYKEKRLQFQHLPSMSI